ncbi:Uncharacterised protein [Mycobacterium tuberculosis]|nr:Uncharacterised protein [Mycobacterium tuberculosis]
MKDQESKGKTPGGVLHELTHKISGVPAHDDAQGLSHQGEPFQGKRPSLNGKLNGKINNGGGHGLNDREHERRVLPGVQNRIARFFGKT